MNAAKRALNSTQNFVSDHKVAITAATTAVVTAVVVKTMTSAAFESAKQFMDERGIFDDYLKTLEDVN